MQANELNGYFKNKFKNLLFEIDSHGIGVLTINRENKLNALNMEVLTELRDCVRDLGRDKEFGLRGLILTGAGEKAFIAGADIAEMKEMNEQKSFEFGELGQEVTLLFEALRFPVIAAVNGFALGGGCEFAMACDFIFATKKSLFGQPEVKLGLIPGFGGTQRLARYIGRQWAREIVYTGRNIDAEEARNLGLVLKIFEDKSALMAGARESLMMMASNSPMAIWHSKRAINFGADLSLKEGMSYELEEFVLSFGSQDKVEGTNAFVEKRRPHFLGK